MDAETVRKASRARWGDLLEAGVEISEYQPTMYHCKVMIVDGLWVSVGSTNFDNRSFSLNDEANLNILDAAFAARQIEIFEQDLARSKPISLAEWQQRPLHGEGHRAHGVAAAAAALGGRQWSGASRGRDYAFSVPWRTDGAAYRC